MSPFLDYWFLGLAALLGLAVGAWLLSLILRQVSFVDSLWSLFFLVAAAVYASQAGQLSAGSVLLLVLLTVWSLRLAAHITVRNWGEGEDSRYEAIRQNNEPGFRWKSLFIVFGLQAVLAWIISAPILAAILYGPELTVIAIAAALLWLVGFVFEAGGDWQLMRFRQRDDGQQVLDSGLWRFTRHPNYFGDACIWWAYWLFAVAAGAWWTLFAPLLMTFLIVRVSGVALLEKTITSRRPGYADYVERTSAFFPWPPKAEGDHKTEKVDA